MGHKIMKSNYFVITFAVAGILLFFLLYPRLYPESGIRLELEKSEIGNIASQMVADFEYDISGFKRSVKFRRDNEQLKYLMYNYGASETIDLVTNKVHAFYWTVSWKSTGSIMDMIKRAEDEETQIHSEDDLEKLFSDIRVDLTTSGELIAFRSSSVAQDSNLMSTQEDALQFAMKYLAYFVKDSTALYEYQGAKGDTAYTFTWKRIKKLLGETENIRIRVSGERLISMERDLAPPVNITNIQEHDNFLQIPAIFIFFLFFITLIVIIIQRLRRDEIGIKSGIGFSIIGSFAFIILILFSTHQESLWEILIPLLIVPVFLTLSYLAVIGAGESLCRDIWPEKLLTFDSLQKLKIMYSKFGKAVLRGAALAFIALGSVAGLLWAFSKAKGFYLWNDESDLTTYVSLVPLIYVFSSAFISASFGELIFRLFTVSFLRRRLNSGLLILLFSAVLWTFNFIGNENYMFCPVYFEMIKKFTVGILFVLFFLKYDFMTVFIGALLYKMIEAIHPMMYWGNSYLAWNNYIFWLLIILMIIWACVALRRKFQESQLTQFVPPYIKRMQERERVRRELEIARKVQLSFLPKNLPNIKGIDVSTVCVPALEVGGDYYDFIDIGTGGSKLGVVIGDVSGKGIPAAFHMTLTKGFLKSQVKENFSPKEILIRMNELFYENVERNIFISMIYGVFDVVKSTFCFARAGHNPIIIRSTGSHRMEDLCPRGLALGLERGAIFNKHIEEQTIKIRSGDVFVLYTDGISEAMNQDMEEFGQNRLQKIVSKNVHQPANQIMNLIRQEVQYFTGDTPQHDDMTMIILKIL